MDVRAQDLLDASEEPAALLDGTGAIIAANAAWTCAPCLAAPAAAAMLARLRAALVGGEARAIDTYSAGDGEGRRDFRLEASRIAGAEAVLVRRIETTRERRATERRESLAARLSALLDACADATLTIDASGTVREVNRAVTTLFGYEAEEIVGRNVALLMPVREAAAHDRWISAFLRTGEAHVIGRERIVEARRRDGVLVPVRLTVREAHANGERLFVGLLRDVSEARRQREALDRSMLGYELALEAGNLGSFDIDVATRGVSADRRAREAFGLDPDRPLCCADVATRLAREDVLRLSDALSHAVAGGRLDAETRVALPDGSERHVAVRGRLMRREGVDHVVGVVADITERRRAEADRLREERDRYVIGEMRHRIKNLFTMVGAILNLSARGHEGAADYKRAVESRLSALEATQTRLAESGWKASRLADIVSRELEPFRERRVANEVEGCEILVDGHAAQVLAMIAHELATNAAKHGALGTPEGHVRVTCARTAEGRGEGAKKGIVLDWHEQGGPAVSPPTHAGFGTTVTVRMAERFLGARVETAWEPDGFRYRLELPAERVLGEG
ncbi:PAS domain S-box protein [Salinarimonas ramus]|uniref:Blue-light-activated histidine kinase n=1 Tax=Salinarimonas ramus TaxID=690164 RepID=A0A917Q4Q2_9HYPH|nr:PAS domain S-box protein [Salinarimonas ramus]GGK22914.1 hypothetical protein GCM10011322_07100 [Salinarimonas ramus]